MLVLKMSCFVQAVLLCILLHPAVAGIDGSISGTVTDSQGVVVPQAKVKLFNKEGIMVKETQTSMTGEFNLLPIKTGDYDISIEAEGLTSSRSDVHVDSGADTSVNEKLGQVLPSQEMVVEVKAKRHYVQNTSSASKSTVTQEEIRQLPQGSEISLPKLITSTTPGVVAGPFGQMFFRGNHANVQYQIDGVQLPESPSNTFGQAFSPRNIDQMEVITGGFSAEYGLRLSSVVNIATKSGPEKPGGEIELNYGSYNTVSPHLLYGGSNESGSLHYFFSANQFFTDRGIDTPEPESTDSLNQGGSDSIHNRAFGNSEFAKVDWQLDNSNKLSFMAFHSYSKYQIPNYPSSFGPDSLMFLNPGHQEHAGHSHEHAEGNGHGDHDHNHGSGHSQNHDDHNHGHSHSHGHGHSHGHNHDHDHDHDHDDHKETAAHGSATTPVYRPSGTDDTQSERNLFLQTVWKHAFNEKSFLQLAPYYKFSQVIVTNDRVNDLITAPGGTYSNVSATAETTPSSFAQNRRVNNLGLKSDFSIRATEEHLIKTGFQLQGSRAEGFYSVERSLDGSKPSILNSDPTTGFFESLYVQDEYTVIRPLTLNVGLRFDATQFHFSDLHTSDSLLQPRLGLSYRATDTTQLHVFYGKLFQPSAVENLRSSFNAISTSAMPYDIKAEKDDYYEVGVAQQVGQHVLQFNLYYKDAQNMLDDAQLANTALAQPYNYATGYAYGAELSLKGKITEDWLEYANYSYAIAKGKGISGGQWATDEPPSTSYQFLDHVQVHTANLGVTYAKNYFWWTGQGLFGSGLRTGEAKEITLPSHLTFDTTVGYEFHGKSWLSQFRLSGDVLNIFDNKYPITLANSFTGSHYAAGRQFFIRLAKSL